MKEELHELMELRSTIRGTSHSTNTSTSTPAGSSTDKSTFQRRLDLETEHGEDSTRMRCTHD